MLMEPSMQLWSITAAVHVYFRPPEDPAPSLCMCMVIQSLILPIAICPGDGTCCLSLLNFMICRPISAACQGASGQ